jgi:hypothetical protein
MKHPNPYAYISPRVAKLHKNDAPQPPATPHHTSHPNSSPTANGVGMKAGRHQGSAAQHFVGAMRTNNSW